MALSKNSIIQNFQIQTKKFQNDEQLAARIQTRDLLQSFKPVIFLNSAQETIATNEATNTNQLEIEAANAAQTACNYDNEATATLLLN
ncbi:hypothetical protein G9A89_008472 [Geosiphon pyriformis]|nr:hypothetical protein G9A89_008472 [Geosiphon pyriformis]